MGELREGTTTLLFIDFEGAGADVALDRGRRFSGAALELAGRPGRGGSSGGRGPLTC